jgi:acyl transferase domain-containing protein
MGIVRPEKATDLNAEVHYLLTFSASNAESLRLTVQRHEEYLHAHPECLHDLSYTLNVRREPLSHRAFAVVTKECLHQPLQVSNHKQVMGGKVPVSFVFTGQGAQWAQMSAELFESNFVFQESMAKMQAALQQCVDPPSWTLKGELMSLVNLSHAYSIR